MRSPSSLVCPFGVFIPLLNGKAAGLWVDGKAVGLGLDGIAARHAHARWHGCWTHLDSMTWLLDTSGLDGMAAGHTWGLRWSCPWPISSPEMFPALCATFFLSRRLLVLSAVISGLDVLKGLSFSPHWRWRLVALAHWRPWWMKLDLFLSENPPSLLTCPPFLISSIDPLNDYGMSSWKPDRNLDLERTLLASSISSLMKLSIIILNSSMHTSALLVIARYFKASFEICSSDSW